MNNNIYKLTIDCYIYDEQKDNFVELVNKQQCKIFINVGPH